MDNATTGTMPQPGRSRQTAAEAIRAGQDRFVSIWGDMGSAWGIPRSMAEVHALLYINEAPMTADEIVERLTISRGSVSMTLRSLLDWGIVQRTHRRGDRKEYFRAEKDVWEMFRIILRERKRREIDPVLVALYECRDITSPIHLADKESEEVSAHNRRLDQMLEMMELVDRLAGRFVSPAGKGLRLAASVLGKAI